MRALNITTAGVEFQIPFARDLCSLVAYGAIHGAFRAYFGRPANR